MRKVTTLSPLQRGLMEFVTMVTYQQHPKMPTVPKVERIRWKLQLPRRNWERLQSPSQSLGNDKGMHKLYAGVTFTTKGETKIFRNVLTKRDPPRILWTINIGRQ